MSKIERATFFESFSTNSKQSRIRNQASPNAANQFHNTLIERAKRALDDEAQQKDRQQHAATLQALLQKIEDISERLHQQLTWGTIMEYKETIASILQLAHSDLAEVQTVVSRYGGEQRKRFVLLKNIDNKMEEMVQQFLQKERKQLKILELVGEINGLIFDLQS